MDKLTGLYQLPDEYYNALIAVTHRLCRAWLTLDGGGDFQEAAKLLMEAREFVCAAFSATKALPPEEDTGISRESLKMSIGPLVKTARQLMEELEPLLNDDYAAACSLVESKGVRVMFAVKTTLDSLCAGSTLRRLNPPAPSELN